MESRQNADVEGGSGRTTGLDRQRQIDLLMEWRDALVAIVEDNPDAVETRKALMDIEAQIAVLTLVANVRGGAVRPCTNFGGGVSEGA